MTVMLVSVMAILTGLLGVVLGYPVGGIGGAILYAALLAIGGALLGALLARTGRVVVALGATTSFGGWRLLAACAGMVAFVVLTWGVYL